MREMLFGYDQSRITAFFQSDDAFVRCGENAWRFQDCRIAVEGLPPHILSKTVSTPRTKVTLSGDAADVEAVYNRLFLQFLSVGG